LEHPTATSLLSLARISKSFVVNHVPNTPVGDDHVNITSSIKRATRLSPETRVTLGGYYGGHPPKNGPIFSQKSTRAKCGSTSASSKIRIGHRQPSGKDARVRDSLRLREDTPFSLASGPACGSQKSNFPNSNLLRKKEKQNSAIK
jgi:hypothetical protein